MGNVVTVKVETPEGGFVEVEVEDLDVNLDHLVTALLILTSEHNDTETSYARQLFVSLLAELEGSDQFNEETLDAILLEESFRRSGVDVSIDDMFKKLTGDEDE